MPIPATGIIAFIERRISHEINAFLQREKSRLASGASLFFRAENGDFFVARGGFVCSQRLKRRRGSTQSRRGAPGSLGKISRGGAKTRGLAEQNALTSSPSAPLRATKDFARRRS